MAELTLHNFQNKYFYKTDLIKICREYHLSTYGTKAELNHYIYLYLAGTTANKIKPKRTIQKIPRLTANQITLETKLIGSGFSFNSGAREFFANYFKVDHFSFKKEMAIIKRQAETDDNTNITVGDLIIKFMALKYVAVTKTDEEATYQWNTFVKDFCQSPESQVFNNKLKVAALLWQHVKDSNQPKKYTKSLLTKYTNEIEYL